jgi:hypothetical protein
VQAAPFIGVLAWYSPAALRRREPHFSQDVTFITCCRKPEPATLSAAPFSGTGRSPSADALDLTPDDVREDIPKARALVEVAAKFLGEMSPY